MIGSIKLIAKNIRLKIETLTMYDRRLVPLKDDLANKAKRIYLQKRFKQYSLENAQELKESFMIGLLRAFYFSAHRHS